MALKDVVKINRKTFFDPVRWMGLGQVKALNRTIWSIVSDLFILPTAGKGESFHAAMKRLSVSDEDLANIHNKYSAYSFLFILLSILSFLFAFYLIVVHKTVSGLMLALAVSALFGSQSFKYSFWAFQIKHRKLGCTVDEWRSGKITPVAGAKK